MPICPHFQHIPVFFTQSLAIGSEKSVKLLAAWKLHKFIGGITPHKNWNLAFASA
jgi:hypothetical protein